MTEGHIANIDLVKQVNTAAVYRLIDERGPISRIQVAELSQLAPASITKITRQLLEHNLISEVALQESTGGRRAISLTTVRDRLRFISCRLGRRTLHLSLCDLNGNEVVHVEQSIQVTGNEAILTLLISAISQLQQQHAAQGQAPLALAITLPGLVNPDSGEVIYMSRLDLHQLPLGALLSEHFALPVFLGNDTRSLALAEHYFGASRDCQDSILISVHNGAGAGIISNGRVLLGKNRNVGEIGHIQMKPFGRRCHCGNFGCLETIAANPAIVEQAQALLLQGHASCLKAEALTIEQICQAATQGDELARHVITEVGEYLGRTIAIMVNLFNPEKILLTGEIVAAEAILFPAIQRCIAQQSWPSFHQNQPIARAHFQAQATIGGIALVKRALLEGDLLQRIMEKTDR